MVRALASHQCDLGSISGFGIICGFSLLPVVVLAPRGFSPGTPGFHSPQKSTFPNSNSIWIIVKHFIMSLWLGRLRKHSCVIDIKFDYLFIYYYYYYLRPALTFMPLVLVLMFVICNSDITTPSILKDPEFEENHNLLHQLKNFLLN